MDLRPFVPIPATFKACTTARGRILRSSPSTLGEGKRRVNTISYTIRHSFRAPRRVAAVVLALAIGVPASVLAADVFNDVPGTGLFHDEIGALAGAGITAGCGGGNFCPTTTITREQEAAFLNRALPRVARTLVPVTIIAPFTVTEVGAVAIRVGGTNSLAIGANQFVKVDATFTFFYAEGVADCPCAFQVRLEEDAFFDGGTDGEHFGIVLVGQSQQIVSVSRVFEATPGVHNYTVTMTWTGSGSMQTGYGSVIATSIPFGFDGGNSLVGFGITGSGASHAGTGTQAGD